MKSIVLEIGVNRGQDTMRLINVHKPDHLYGFEPVPRLFTDATKKFRGNPKITIIEKAVDVENGTATFNVSPRHGGCSSLHTFSDTVQEDWDAQAKATGSTHWIGRNDFTIQKSLVVQKTRLDSFLDTIEFDTIKFVHCDAQGNDINVIRSLGKYMDKVEAGVIEVAKTVSLYANEENTEEYAIKFLNENGFTVVRHKDDAIGAETNIFFRRG